jgi:RNA polymerase sigma factor (sigma-70 family)
MNEDELINQLKQGNELAFKQLVDTYKNRIYSSAFNILQNQAEAEDATQETFIKVYQSIHNFKQASSLNTWVYTIAIRNAIEKLRKKKVINKWKNIFWINNVANNTATTFHHPGVALEDKENAAILFKAIANLPTRQHIAFTLIKIEGRPYAEVCEMMQLSVKALESLISRAKMNLQTALKIINK